MSVAMGQEEEGSVLYASLRRNVYARYCCEASIFAFDLPMNRLENPMAPMGNGGTIESGSIDHAGASVTPMGNRVTIETPVSMDEAAAAIPTTTGNGGTIEIAGDATIDEVGAAATPMDGGETIEAAAIEADAASIEADSILNRPIGGMPLEKNS